MRGHRMFHKTRRIKTKIYNIQFVINHFYCMHAGRRWCLGVCVGGRQRERGHQGKKIENHFYRLQDVFTLEKKVKEGGNQQ